jgi:hypothetical protein
MSATIAKLDESLRSELLQKRAKQARDDEVELPIIGMSETLLGPMTDDERELFLDLAYYSGEFDEARKTMIADFYVRAGNELRAIDHMDKFDPSKSNVFHSAEDARGFFELQAMVECLHGLLAVRLGQRFGFGQKFGYRKGFNIVRTGYKYDNKFK